MRGHRCAARQLQHPWVLVHVQDQLSSASCARCDSAGDADLADRCFQALLHEAQLLVQGLATACRAGLSLTIGSIILGLIRCFIFFAALGAGCVWSPLYSTSFTLPVSGSRSTIFLAGQPMWLHL